MIIVFLGPPGSGKGTQANKLAEKLGIPLISTGDILREEVSRASVFGLKAKGFMEQGQLVPDADVINIIVNRVKGDDCAKGFILDGFPRTLVQAQELDKSLKQIKKEIDKVVFLDVSQDVVIERNSQRRVCKGCRTTYHLKYAPPQRENICDKCGSELFQRPDDIPATIAERYQVYLEQTRELTDFYQDKITTINGNNSIGMIEEDINEAFNLVKPTD